MTKRQAQVKAELMQRYSEQLDKLLEKSQGLEDFGEMEEAVNEFAEATLPQTLSELQASKDFSPAVSKVSKGGQK
jgi:hypothetical protein